MTRAALAWLPRGLLLGIVAFAIFATLGTSVAIALFCVVVCLALAVPAGFALARGRLPWRGAILLAFLLPQAFPSLAVYFNVARIFYTVGLNGTIAGVVLVHAT